MNPTVRAKFTCASNDGSTVQLQPVYSGSEENRAFFQATPSGEVKLYMTNPDVAARFVVGKEYYIDFTPAG